MSLPSQEDIDAYFSPKQSYDYHDICLSAAKTILVKHVGWVEDRNPTIPSRWFSLSLNTNPCHPEEFQQRRISRVLSFNKDPSLPLRMTLSVYTAGG